MKKNNNLDYDTLTLLVKKEKQEEIIKCYQNFGWELVGNNENRKYEDIVDLIFKRPHKIKNKDELQLQQVYMEERLNEIGKLERHKHSKTTGFCLFFGVIGLAMIIYGLYLILKFNIAQIPISISQLSVGFVFCLATIIFAPKIYKKEKKTFHEKTIKLQEELKAIYEVVSTLTGGGYEDK